MKRFLSLFLIIPLLFSCDIFSSDEEVSLESFSFQDESIKVRVGETVSEKILITPKSLYKDVKVKYTVSNDSDIVELSEKTSNGLLIKGVKYGSCVIMAECKGFISYLTVLVEGEAEITEKYIVVSNPVSEMKVGERKTFSVSLFGGNDTSVNFFEYKNSNDEVLRVETVKNNVICTALHSGYSKITVTHPDSDYTNTILVYVKRNTEDFCYITTDENVIMAGLTDGTRNIKVSLVGSKDNNISLFTFTTESKCIELISNNNVCSINPLSTGSAVIKVSHPDCEIDFEINVIVVKTISELYIESDVSHLEFTDAKSKTVNCFIQGEEGKEDFSFSLSNSSVCSVNRVNSSFFVTPLTDGQCILTVSSDKVKFDHEILIVVSGLIEGDKYLTTYNPVIKMEVGDEKEVQVILTGGEEKDRGNFIWENLSKSVVEILGGDGSSRSLSVIDGTCHIKALTVGKGTIIVKNTLVQNSLNLTVLVYQKGTLNENVDVKGESIFKVLIGQTKEYKPEFSKEITDFGFENENKDVIDVNLLSSSLSITGKSRGSSVVKLTGKEFSSEYSFLVLCAQTEEEFDSMNYIYTDKLSLQTYINTPVYIEMKSNGEVNSSLYKASFVGEKLGDLQVNSNIIIFKGTVQGSGIIRVTNETSTNYVDIKIDVLNELSLDQPYYFTYDKFVGLVVGKTKNYKVFLNSASDAEKQKISWTSEDDKICKVIGSGEEVNLISEQVGETYIEGKSIKAKDSAKVFVYTALTEQELENYTVLTVDKTNYLLETGETIFFSCKTNRTEKIKDIKWSCSDTGVLSISPDGESCLVKALSEGNCVVKVSLDGVSDKNIYVTVKDNIDYSIPEISLPSILELIKGENKTVNAVITAFSDSDIRDIKWINSDDEVLTIRGNGEDCFISPLKKGFSEITCKSSKYAIEKKIECVVYDSYEDYLDNKSCIMALDKSYYKIEKDSILDLYLRYGSVVPSDKTVSSIKWETDNTDIVSLQYSGSRCSVYGLNEGVAFITVSADEGFINSLTFSVAVGFVDESRYYIKVSKIVPIVNGTKKEIEAKLTDLYGNNVNKGLNLFKYKIEDNDIVKISQADNVFSVEALKTGNIYLELSHPDCDSISRILIYTADNESSLESMYPLQSDKDYYLISQGDSVTLKVNTINDDKINDIKWSVSNAAVLSYENGNSKKELKVTGKKTGNCTVTVSHPDSANDCIFNVSVNEYKDNSYVFKSESIIKLLKDGTYVTNIETDLKDSEIQKFIWKTESAKFSIEGNGKSCLIEGKEKGNGEIFVYYGEDYRRILVYVYETIEELMNDNLMNISDMYRKIYKGESETFVPFYDSSEIPSNLTHYQDLFVNNVVNYKEDNGRLYVTGINEGVAAFKVTNDKADNSFIVYVEVLDKENPSVTTTDIGYLTQLKNVYVLDISDPLTFIECEVLPVGIKEENYSSIKWKAKDETVLRVVQNGSKASIFGNKTGYSDVEVTSPYSTNTLSLRVYVTDGSNVKLPEYLTVEKNTFDLKTGEIKEIQIENHNISNFDVTKLDVTESVEGIVSVTLAGDKIKVRALSDGQTLLTVLYDEGKKVTPIKFVVSVSGVVENPVHLKASGSTYYEIPVGSKKTLSLEIINFTEYDSRNFTWKIENSSRTDGKKVLSLVSNGKEAIVEALNEGLCVIKAEHNNGDNSAINTLSYTVKVVADDEVNPKYIRLSDNIVEITEGESYTVNAEIVNGKEIDSSQFTSSQNGDCFTVEQAAGSFYVTGKNKGTGYVIVTHPLFPDQQAKFIVTVKEKVSDSSIYMTTDSSFVEMKPTDNYKKISCTLVGGTIAQNQLFSFKVDSSDDAKVIEIVQSQNEVIIYPKNEGETFIRVTNKACPNQTLSIKVVVQMYKTLSCEVTNCTLLEGEEKQFLIFAPYGKTVTALSSYGEVCDAECTSGNLVVKAKKEGTSIITLKTSDNSYCQVIVRVNKNDNIPEKYIKTDFNVLTLNALTDSSGVEIGALLTGNGVKLSDSDNLVWKIGSGKTDVIKVLGDGNKTAKGKSIKVYPVKKGQDTLVIHSDGVTDKTIYVEVVQSNVSLTLDNYSYITNVNNTFTLSAVLSGALPGEEENITWEIQGDNEVLRFVGSDKGTTKVTLQSIKSGEAQVNVTYDGITKTCAVLVNEEVSINVFNPNITCMFETEYSVRFRLTPAPSDKTEYSCISGSWQNIQNNKSSGEYVTFTEPGELDPNDRGLIAAKFTTTNDEGVGRFTIKYRDVTSTVEVVTKSDVRMLYEKYEVYEGSNNKLVSTVLKPTSVNALKGQYVKLYYKSELDADGKKVGFTNADNRDFNFTDCTNVYRNINKNFVRINQEENGDDGFYLTIIPLSSGYGTVTLLNENYPSLKSELPICFGFDDISLVLESDCKSKENHEYWSQVINNSNSVITLINNISYKFRLNSLSSPSQSEWQNFMYKAEFKGVTNTKVNSSYFNKNKESSFTNDNFFYGDLKSSRYTETNYSETYTRRDVIYEGLLRIEIFYPSDFMMKSRVYTFIVNSEQYN